LGSGVKIYAFLTSVIDGPRDRPQPFAAVTPKKEPLNVRGTVHPGWGFPCFSQCISISFAALSVTPQLSNLDSWSTVVNLSMHQPTVSCKRPLMMKYEVSIPGLYFVQGDCNTMADANSTGVLFRLTPRLFRLSLQWKWHSSGWRPVLRMSVGMRATVCAWKLILQYWIYMTCYFGLFVITCGNLNSWHIYLKTILNLSFPCSFVSHVYRWKVVVTAINLTFACDVRKSVHWPGFIFRIKSLRKLFWNIQCYSCVTGGWSTRVYPKVSGMSR